MRRLMGLLSVPVICALVAWLWVGIAPAGGPAGAAGLSMAVAVADEPKPKDKQAEDQDSGDEKSDDQGKDDKGKDQKKSEDKPGGKKEKEADQKEPPAKDKEAQDKDAQAKDQKTKDQAKKDQKKKRRKKKDDKKTTGGALSDEDLAKMKKMLMERVQKGGDQSTSQPAPSEPQPTEEEADQDQPAESQPAPKPKEDQPEAAEPSTPEAGPAAEAGAVDEQEEPPPTQEESEEVGEPDSAKIPRPHLQSRPGTKPLRRTLPRARGSKPERKPAPAPSATKRGAQPEEDAREPAERSSRRRARGGPSGRDEPRDRDEPTVIMPIDLPEGMRAWDMPDDWRPFFFSFDNVPIRDVLNDWSRMAGLSILNLGKAKGQLTYQSLEYMNYWEAFALLNELLADSGLQIHQEKQHLRLVSPSEIREYISAEHTFTSRDEFEQARPHDYAIVKVFFVPPTNVAPSQVAQWINDLPESVRLGSSAEGHMHVSGNAKDVRKLFRLVDIVNVQVPVEGLRWRWIPVENVDVNQVASLARQYVDTQGPAPQPRSSRKRGAPTVALDDYAEVDVIAVPKSRMLLVRARPTTLDRIEALVREIDGRYIEKVDVEPVIIPLQHAKAEEIIPLLESILTGEALTTTGRRAPKTSVRGKKGATPGADELDLSRSEEDIQLLPEPNTNSLIVIADQEGIERVRQLLEVFDVPSIAPVFERVALKHAEAETVQQVLTTLYGGKRKKGSGSAEELTIIPDLAANALFLAGKEDAVNRARQVVEQMDVATASSVTHLVTLVNQTPTALAQILNQMESGGRRKSKASVGAEGVKIIGDDATATLIVVCPDARWPELKELIETLDRDVEDFLVTRTFKIEGADAQQVANLLKEMFGGRSGRQKGKKAQPEGVAISVDPTGNLIFVRGEEDTIERMAAVIQEMEAEVASRETTRRTFQLVYTSASDMVKALTTFYPATSPGRGKSKIVPGEATFAPVGRSTVVVETTAENMEEIVALIGELDTEAGDQGEIRSFVVKDADPQQVVRALQSMFEARGGGKRKGAAAAGPSFTALGKKIIVVAEPALFGRIAEAVAQFEGEGPAIEYRRFPVQYADTEELGKLVEDLLNTRAASTEIGFTPVKGGKGRKATSGSVTVSADPRTKTLFVAAPGELMTYAEELIEALDAPQPEDVEELIVRTVPLERAEVGEMIDSLRQMMSGRAETTPRRAAGKKVARPSQAQMIGKIKGTVSMVPAPGADAVILRGIESDVDEVEQLILAIDAAALSQRKVARRYDAMPTGMGADELADTIMAVADGAKPSRKDAAEDEFAMGPRVGKDLVITTDWYTDMVLVIATPEKQTEVELLLEALSYDTEGPEGESSRWPIQMVEIAHADPYDIRDAVEEVVDDIVERGPKTRVRVIEGANMLSLTGPADQVEAILEVIATMDVPGRQLPPALAIRSVSSPVPLERVLQLVQQQLPEVELEIEGAGQVLPGYGVEEVPVVEEILPTLGPNTLAYISTELQRLALAASDEEDQDGETAVAAEPPPEPEAQAEPESEATDQPPAPPKVKIAFDPKTGTFRLQGPPRYVEQVNDAIDEVLDELKKLPIRPDIRVFRIRYANVNDVAQIMESILGAQSGGAASRRQQQLAQQLRLQQQMLRQRQTQQQQAQMRRMMQQMGQKEEQEPEKEEEEEPKEHEDEAKEFGTTRVRIYPDPRTSTIIVRAAPEDYPTIVELIAKIDKQGPQLTDFRIFKLTKLKAADVEAAIKAILRLDRQATRVARPGPGQRPGQPQTGGQMQMIAQLQQELAQAQQADAEDAVSINWAEQVTITSDTPTNSILASGPTQAIDYIESMIEKLEGQEIEKETVKTIQLVHTTVEEALPVLTETFAPRGAAGGAGGRLRMPGGAGQQEAVQTAVSQVIITGDSRTNTLIVKAVERDMAEVEALIARLDVDTGDEGRMQPYRLRYADAASMAKALNDIYLSGERGQKTGRVRIVADPGTNSILLSAPPTLREEIVEQIRSLDTIKGEESKPRTIAITAGNAETIAQKLQQVFGKRGQLAGEVSILGDNVAKQLVVVAPDAVFQQIATLVGSMDKAGSEAHIQIYELEHALAEETLTRMQEMIKQMAMNKALYGAGKDVDLDTFAATADPRTNSIVVMGSPGTHLLIGSTLAKMDVPPKDSTQVATAIFPLVVGDANDVARQVQQLFATRARTGGEPPVATPNPGMNTLIVRGTQAQLDEVQKLINDLEGLTPPGQGELESYTIRLLYAKAEDVANTLNEYFRKKFEAMTRGGVKGVKPTDLQVTITPDINSNQIFVTASELNKVEIDQLLATMDVEGAGAQTTLQTRIFSLTFADPGQTANAINNAFMQRGQFADSERVQAVAEYGTRSLIISANAENMDKVQELITQLDADTGTGRQNFTYQVSEARVVDLVNVLRDFVNQSLSRAGRGEQPIALVANEATNTMLISATQQEYDELLPTIELLDRPPEAETGRYAKAYKLKYSDPDSTYRIITDAFQQRGRLQPEDVVTAAVDWGTATLIVVANQENHDKVTALLGEMDQADVSGMEVRQIEVKNAGAQEVTQALQQTFIQGQRQRGGESSISIVNPPGTRMILVRSDERTFEEIRRVVADLDTPEGLGGGDARVVMLENVDPEEAKTILEDYLRKPGGRANELIGNMRVSAAQSLNAVVISGPTEQIEQAVAVVQEFDLDPTERGEAPQVIQIEHGDAVQIAETLARMFEQTGGRGRGRAATEPPVIEAVAGSNSLIVKARKPDMNMLRSVVASLDTPEMAKGASNIEIIQVAQGIDVDDLAANLERVINDAERERVKQQKGAKASEISIETDRRTNTMLVAGTPSQVVHVRALVSQLEDMKPVGPSKILIRKPLHRSAAEIKEVLDELIEEKSGTTTRSRSRGTTPRRPPARTSRGRGR